MTFPPAGTAALAAHEWWFHCLLATERKRCDRTGARLILMTADFSALGVIPRGVEESIRREIRGTDTIGRYKNPLALGVLFTGVSGDEPNSIRAVLARKADRALVAVLGSADAGRVVVKFHFFPEDVDKERLCFGSDESLYPDLYWRDRSRYAYLFLKRAMDLLGSLTALILCSPLFVAIALFIKLTSSGPVLFRQQRTGRFGNEFCFLKFRTMYAGNDSEIHRRHIEDLIQSREGKPACKIADDPRVTPVGSFLRKTSLDELPQFLNVLRGEMSLVGPRPPIPYEIACYRSWHRRRVIEAKPGITGLWQVCGRSRTSFDDMVRLDLRYAREQSFWLDLKIIFRTPLAVLSGRGAG